jgi:hypothetical protein
MQYQVAAAPAADIVIVTLPAEDTNEDQTTVAPCVALGEQDTAAPVGMLVQVLALAPEAAVKLAIVHAPTELTATPELPIFIFPVEPP